MYLAALSGLVCAAAIAGAYWVGHGAGEDAALARQATIEQVAQRTGAVAGVQAARAIAGIKVQHTTIRQEAEREIQTRVEYRDCKHSPEQLQRINAAIAAAGSASGAGQLPPAGSPPR
jgi:trimethylamine:corrinoid methyltransferase-like protein